MRQHTQNVSTRLCVPMKTLSGAQVFTTRFKAFKRRLNIWPTHLFFIQHTVSNLRYIYIADTFPMSILDFYGNRKTQEFLPQTRNRHDVRQLITDVSTFMSTRVGAKYEVLTCVGEENPLWHVLQRSIFILVSDFCSSDRLQHERGLGLIENPPAPASWKRNTQQKYIYFKVHKEPSWPAIGGNRSRVYLARRQQPWRARTP